MIWSVSTFSVGQHDDVALNVALRVGSRAGHTATLEQVRGSVIAPVTAAAAAVSGLARKRAPAAALAALEVAVAGADGVLAGRELVAVHGDAHRAAGLAPLGAGVAEHAVEPFGLGLALDLLRARHDEHAHARRDLAAAQHAGRSAQVGDARVGAAADEHDVDRRAEQRLPRGSSPM